MIYLVYIGAIALIFSAGVYFGRMWGRSKQDENLINQLKEKEQLVIGYVAHIQNLEARHDKLRQSIRDELHDHPDVDAYVELWDRSRGVSKDTDTTED